jgi:hypothetical protein
MSGLLIVANRLNANADLKAKVPVARLFMVVAPQATPAPYLLISQVSGSDGVHLDGQDEYPRERIQIDVVATSYTEARAVIDLVKAALRNIIKSTISSVGVKDVDVIHTGMEITDYNDDRTAVILITDFMVRWRKQ